MVINFTDDADLTSRGKRIASIGLLVPNAGDVNIRRGSVTGAVVWSFQFAAAGSQHFAWPSPIYVAEGVFIQCTVPITLGSIDLI